MKSIDEARREVLQSITPIARSETIPMSDVVGRIIARDLHALLDSPRFATAAMDGFLLFANDSPGRLRLGPTLAAGDAAAIPQGMVPNVPTAAKIFTGASIDPAWGDAIAIWEDCTVGPAEITPAGHEPVRWVQVPATPPGQHIRKVGEDIERGARLWTKGTRLRTADVFVLAAQGWTHVDVVARPHVRVISTGHELCSPDHPLGPASIYDSNGPGIAAMSRAVGATVLGGPAVPDDVDAITRAIESAIQTGADAVIMTGGVSGGERDFVRDAIARAGGELRLWKVAMKPGKPFAYAHIGTCPIFALPGNPVSAATSFELFVAPALRKLGGASGWDPNRQWVELASDVRKPAGRAHVLRVALRAEAGTKCAYVHPKQGSGMMSSLLDWDATLIVPAEVTQLPAGTQVEVWLRDASPL